MKRTIITAALLLSYSFGVYAGELKYICTVKQIFDLSFEGELVKHEGPYESLVGNKFTIDRVSGDMIGLPFTTRSYKTITVLERGSEEMSYKAIVISHQPNIWVMHIEVREFIGGKFKPFWGSEGGYIYSGLCE